MKGNAPAPYRAVTITDTKSGHIVYDGIVDWATLQNVGKAYGARADILVTLWKGNSTQALPINDRRSHTLSFASELPRKDQIENTMARKLL